MNASFNWQYATLALLAGLITGCGDSIETPASPENSGSAPQWSELGDGPGVELEGDFVMCGKLERQTASGVETTPEYYSFARLNAQLEANARLRSKVAEFGVSAVDSCKAARIVAQARGELTTVKPTAADLAAAELAGERDATTRTQGATSLPAEEGLLESAPGRVDKIGSGTLALHAPTVQLAIWFGAGANSCKTCSGSLIGPNTILTAAHCVVADHSNRPISVKASNLDCLHGNCGDIFATDQMCSNKPSGNSTTYFYPDYSGTGDWVEDVGLIVMDNNHPAPYASSSHWIRIVREHYRLGELYRLRGWGASSESGAGAGQLRRSNQEVANQSSSEHRMLQHTVVHGQGSACSGDSGGPAVSTSYGFEAVAGVFSGWSGTAPLVSCPRQGETYFHAQTWPKITWIESKIGDCSNFETNGLQYIRCW